MIALQAFSIPQMVGYLGMILSLVAVSQTNDRRFFLAVLLALSAWTTHWYLMGAITGMVSCAIGLSRTVITLRWQGPWVAYPFALLSIVAGYLTWEGWQSGFVIFAGVLGSLVTTLLVGAKLRLGLIGVSATWFVYGAVTGSLGSMMLETISIILFIRAYLSIRKSLT